MMYGMPIDVASAWIGLVVVALIRSTKYSLFDATKNMAYRPLDVDTKTKGQAAVEIISGRGGKAGSALINAFLTNILVVGSKISAHLYTIIPVFILTVAGWIVSVFKLSPKYEEKVLEQERQDKENVQKSNEELSAKISGAAVYKAYNIRSAGYMIKNKGVEEPTDKANRVKRIKTTFILGENSLIESGPVNVYCRIAVPGTGKVLTMGSGDTYSFVHNGQRLQYSAKSVVNYDKQAQNVTMNWDLMSDDKAIKGKYIVQVFTDDQFLGESFFTLK